MLKLKKFNKKIAQARNRTGGPTMATLDFTTKPLALNFLMVLHLRIAYLSMTIHHLVNAHMKQPYNKTNRMSNMR